jgi:hypothetical protein
VKRNSHPLSSTLLLVLAAFFSALLMSTAVLPTVMSVSYGKAIAAPVPVEEEQMHGRDHQKSAVHQHPEWAGSAVCLREKMRASFRHSDEAVPSGPITDVPLQPPKRS